MHVDQNKINSIKVHWYNTRSKNVFITLEISKCAKARGTRKPKTNIHNTLTLNINGVDIIVYDFKLRKGGCLRKLTIDIIKDKLLIRQGVFDRGRTRSTIHDLESHNMVLDEDNALIGTVT